jgi:hypothetical protein
VADLGVYRPLRRQLDPWPAWVSMGWGVYLALDAYKAFSPWPRTMSETEIEREMRRLAPH